jgi:hypothetical protein
LLTGVRNRLRHQVPAVAYDRTGDRRDRAEAGGQRHPDERVAGGEHPPRQGRRCGDDEREAEQDHE